MPKITAKPLVQVATTRLNSEDHEKLKLKAKYQNISTANLLRKLVTNYLKDSYCQH